MLRRFSRKNRGKLTNGKQEEQEDLVDANQEEFAEPVFDKTDMGEGWKV